MSIRVRGNGGRRREGRSTLVRSVPAVKRPVSPGLFTANIYRTMWPAVIADYEGLSSQAWSTGSFYARSSHLNSSPYTWTFSGELWDCLYHVFEVEPSSSTYASVIMEPLRFTIDDPASNGGNYDYWSGGPVTFESLAKCVSPTFLPASGRSHISAGKPGRIGCNFIPNSCIPHVWYLHSPWGKASSYTEADPTPTQWQVYMRYAQIRLNGEPIGPLYDMQELQRWRQMPYSGAPNDLQEYAAQNILFPSDAAWGFVSDFLPDYDFQFDPGDTIEVDAWFVLEALPGASVKYVFAAFSQGVSANGSRTPDASTPLTTPANPPLGGYDNGNPYTMTLTNLEASRGFDPERHTYRFDPSGGWSPMGKAQSDLPPQAWDIVITGTPTDGSFTVTIEGDTIASQDVTVSHDATSAQIQSGIRAMTGTGLSRTTVDKTTGTGVITYRITFHGTEESIDVTVDNNLDTGSIDVDEVAEWQDPESATVTFTVTQSLLTWVFPIVRPGDESGDTYRMRVEMTWGTEEIAELRTKIEQVSGTPGAFISGYMYYRPESDGDYVDTVNDRYDGSKTRGPCGSFLHLGTTVFVQSGENVQTPPYTVTNPSSAYATQITVTKVKQ